MAPRKKVVVSAEDVLISQRACQRLAADPEIAATFEGLQEGYLMAFANSKPDEQGKRELAYQHYKAAVDVWAAIKRKANSAHVRDLRDQAEKPSNG